MKIKNRQQLLIFLTVASIGLLAGDRFVLSPLLKSWRERSDRIAQLRKSIEQGRQLQDREDGVRTRWEQMRTNTLPAAISTAEQQVFEAFDEWSQKSRINITSIKPLWRRDAEDYLTLECRVDASGSLATLTRFLHDIELDPMALKVENVEITSRSDDGQMLALSLQVSGLVLKAEDE